MIKVILREDVKGLGRTGDVKQVKDGFARNFLLPNDLAFMATDHNLRRIEQEKKKLESQRAQEKKKAQELADRLANFSLTLTMEATEDGKLYGSLTAQEISRALAAEGIALDKEDIVLASPIKELGIYDVEARLPSDVTAKVKVWVVKK